MIIAVQSFYMKLPMTTYYSEKERVHISLLSLVRAKCLLAGCLTSQQRASVSQGRICSDNFTCCHTEIEVADPRTGKSEGTLDLWSWESSAKKWYERHEWQIMVLKGCVYKVNRRGPRTEPCVTPHFRTDGVDSWPTNTDWARQLK